MEGFCMDYDVVIATKNRPEALKLSIPLILKQGCKPNKLIIVDSSDNHENIEKTVLETVGNNNINLEILQSKANLPHQRNVGLEHVESPIVMFPDDDSLWWPGVAEATVSIYERDESADVGGVCGKEIRQPPPQIASTHNNFYHMRSSDRFRQWVQEKRHKYEDRFYPDPAWVYGRSLWRIRPVPSWLQEENARLVEYMGGFRMSFRTNIIRRYGFDEALGALAGWTGGEDADASFQVAKMRLLVGAHRARIFHFKHPRRRARGFKLGFVSIFNRAYVICKHTRVHSAARRALKGWVRYKYMLYMLGAHDRFGRDRVKGALTGIRYMNELLNTPKEQLRETYMAICSRVTCDRRW